MGYSDNAIKLYCIVLYCFVEEDRLYSDETSYSYLGNQSIVVLYYIVLYRKTEKKLAKTICYSDKAMKLYYIVLYCIVLLDDDETRCNYLGDQSINQLYCIVLYRKTEKNLAKTMGYSENAIKLYCIVLYCIVLLDDDETRCNYLGNQSINQLYCIVLYRKTEKKLAKTMGYSDNAIKLYCIVLYCIVLYCIVLLDDEEGER